MRSIGWALIQWPERCGHRDRHHTERENSVRTYNITGVMHLQAKKHLRLTEIRREAWNRSFPGAFRGREALSTPPFLTSSPRNCETMNVCSSKPPHVWYFVTAALDTNIALFKFLLKSFIDGEREWANTHESLFSHFNAMSPFFGNSPVIKDAFFFFFNITGLNSTLVSNCREGFLIFTSSYCLEKKQQQRVLL